MSVAKIHAFDFKPGFVINGVYEIVHKLGMGWEGEVYLVREIKTKIERTAKFFLPHRNKNNKTANFYAKKLHKLKNCSVLIQYVTQDNIIFKDFSISFLISEYVDGIPLTEFLNRQTKKRLNLFQALHLLHALSVGVEEIHHQKDYHGDIHPENVIIKRYGLGFELKLIDMFHWGPAKPENIKDDVVDLIRLFYDALGGKEIYKTLHPVAKEIICGLKKGLITKKFKTAGQLKIHLEKINWGH
jgi:tRNA A-37 threonylcarbamoyl transferase component Bud32